MASKLARQLAYKKKLEEEFRLAEERRKFERKSRNSGYQVSAYETWEWGEVPQGRYTDEDESYKVEQNKQKEVENEQKAEENRKKVVYEKQKQEWMKKREVYIERAAKFSEIKKKILEENAKLEKSKRIILEDKDIWAEFDNIIKENEMALKDLENYKITVEIKEKEEKTKIELEEKLRIGLKEILQNDLTKITNADDLSDIEKRIRELELSIASLDNELERFEIEKMNFKTREVKKRMSLVTGDNENDLSKVLNSGNVDSFITDGNLWKKYVFGAK